MSRATSDRLVSRRDGKRSARGFSLDAVDHVFTIAWYNVAINERRMAKRRGQPRPSKADVLALQTEISELAVKVRDYLQTCDRLIAREQSQSEMWQGASARLQQRAHELDEREARIVLRERASRRRLSR